MKHITIFIILLLFFSCSDNKKSGKENVMTDIKDLCNNQIFLLENPKNNWEIPLDSIDNINEFIHYARIRKNEYSSKSNTIQGITFSDSKSKGLNESIEIFNSNVYPYVKVNGVDVSLCQLLHLSSGGFFSNEKDIVIINYHSRKQYEKELWRESVYNYYVGFKNTEIIDTSGINRLEVPLIVLSFRGNTFKDITTILKDITEGYITAIDSISKDKFKEGSCSISPSQLKIIKRGYPLNIRIIKI